MKRKVLAMLVPALLVAGAANAAEIYNKNGNKLDLYGKVDARHTFSDNPSDDGDETIIELGFKGETQITDQLTGYGQALTKTKASDTEGSDNTYVKLAFAGLKFGEMGSFDYGRNYGVIYDVEAWTDMLPVFGGDSYTWTDNFMAGRANGVATGFAPIFPDTCYHLTHYWPAAADIPVASDNPVHYADAIRYNARTPLQGSLLPLTRLV